MHKNPNKVAAYSMHPKDLKVQWSSQQPSKLWAVGSIPASETKVTPTLAELHIK
jgi:hypothetical protein